MHSCKIIRHGQTLEKMGQAAVMPADLLVRFCAIFLGEKLFISAWSRAKMVMFRAFDHMYRGGENALPAHSIALLLTNFKMSQLPARPPVLVIALQESMGMPFATQACGSHRDALTLVRCDLRLGHH